MAKEKIAEKPLRVIGTDGGLTDETEEVLRIVSDHPDVVLATGHISREEVDALVHRCHEVGVRRVLVTHPHFLVDASTDDMKNWQSLGAYMEFTAVISLPSSPIYCRPVGDVAELLKKLDPHKIVLSSDLGLKNAGWPIEGMSVFLNLLREAGVASDDLKQMISINPATLMGLKTNHLSIASHPDLLQVR
jgi:predicted TIM-barrel fold metal-dependent hydrolase